MTESEKKAWLNWLRHYTPRALLENILRVCQNAESTCIHCGEDIYLDLVEGGGVFDWRTASGNYGCTRSFDTDNESVGSHVPIKLEDRR